MFTIRYMKCGRKWRVVAHEGGRKGGVLLYVFLACDMKTFVYYVIAALMLATLLVLIGVP